MKDIIKYIRRKLSVRVSLWVVLFAAIIFNVAFAFLFYQARVTVHQEAISHATQILDNTALRMESILNRVEMASDNVKWLVQRHQDQRAKALRPGPEGPGSGAGTQTGYDFRVGAAGRGNRRRGSRHL